MAVKNGVQLITYPDSLGGNLKNLHQVIEKHFPDTFRGGIHILPPFPSSGDRGFAPLTYLEIEPAFGDWSDIRKLGEKHDILLDLMVNHISGQSEYFQDFLRNGAASPYADLFMPMEKIWHDGAIREDDVAKMFLRRNEPWSDFTIKATGKTERVWTTFGKQTPSEQIDLDINSPAVRRLLTDFLTNFSKQNVKIVRLDAVGYVIKKPGTSCFFVEPEIYEFMDWITGLAGTLGLELLPEVHAHYSIQYKLAERGHWIYDFILPYTVLEALLFKSGRKLCRYLKTRPHQQFTMLDCHDGIPVKPDLDGLVTTAEARRLVAECVQRNANLSKVFSAAHCNDDGFDVHQIRCAYYSMLDGDDDKYMSARAIQFFAPGIPQVYYVGLLAGENDLENVSRTGEGREINRHNYTLDEIDREVKKPVVQRLKKLIDFRNNYPAFHGDFSVIDSPENQVTLLWNNSGAQCTLRTDLLTGKSVIEYTNEAGKPVLYNI